MCGIAGIWRRSGAPVDPETLDRMSAILRHRGPDGAGRFLRGEIGLAHRRLAILDLSEAGDQPMATPDGSLWLDYNGEIHDYLELRRELEDLGVRFRSVSDTEVVLWAYRLWGPACFERFNGMWALALWDARARRLVLSRDRFGIKPLCYSVRGDRVAFASEAKAILTAFPEERTPDRRAIHAFLSGAYPDVGEETFFANVRSLPPGTFAVFESDGHHVVPYWSFRPGAESPRPDAAERFAWLLEDAVRLRMRSDVPVGACLSGGLDSSAVVRLALPPPARPMHCFSLRYDDPAVDESRFAAQVADDPGRWELHWVRPDPAAALETIGGIVWHHDAPTPLRGRFPQWFVMREAAQHVKVVLDGQGADEVLGGYARFVLPYLLDRLRGAGGESAPPGAGSGGWLGVLAELPGLRAVSGSPALSFPLRILKEPLKRYVGLDEWPWDRVHTRAFDREHARVPSVRHAHAWLRPDVERPYRSHLNNALWLELRYAGLPEVLHCEDALSMAFSIESRVPFLDHRIVEFCFSLPFDEKIRDGWTKSLLRRALAGRLPPDVLARRLKVGFPAPFTSLLRAPETLRDVHDLLLGPTCLERGILDGRRVERRLRYFRSASRSDASPRAQEIWRWVTLELWFRRFVDATPLPPTAPRPRSAPARPPSATP